MAVKEVGEWRTMYLDNYEQVVKTLNSFKLKKEDVLKIDKDEKTGQIIIIYFW